MREINCILCKAVIGYACDFNPRHFHAVCPACKDRPIELIPMTREKRAEILKATAAESRKRMES